MTRINLADRRSTVLILALLSALGTLSTNILLPSLPSIAASLNVPFAAMGLTLSVFFICFAVSQLVVGPLSDRLGRRPLVLGGLLIFSLGSLICSSADDLQTFLAGRAVQAIGVSAASVLARAIARDLFQGVALGKAMALIMVVMAASPGFSPLLGGLLDNALGWRAVPGAVALAGILSALIYALMVGETLPTSNRTLHSPSAIVWSYGQLLIDGRFIMPALSVSLLMGALFAFFGSSPAILMVGHKLSSFQVGGFFAGTVLIVFAGGILASRKAQSIGSDRLSAIGLLIASLGGIVLLGLHYLSAFSVVTYTSAICLFLFGMGMANPLVTAITLTPFGSNAGTASALLGFLQMVFAALGTQVAASISSEPALGLGIVMTSMSLLAVVTFLLKR